jgi:hypothetical protein
MRLPPARVAASFLTWLIPSGLAAAANEYYFHSASINGLDYLLLILGVDEEDPVFFFDF